MKTFQRQMRKVLDKNGKLKEYNISLGVKSQINEDRFYLNKKEKMVCDVLICFPDEYEKFWKEYENSQSKIQSLQNEILEKNNSIESMENELSSIHEKHEKELKNVKDELNGQVEELKEDLHQKDIEIEKTKTEYEKKIGNLKEANQNHINGLKLFDEEKHIPIKDHNEEVSRLMESQFNPESDMKIKDHVNLFNQIKNDIFENLLHHNDNLNRLDSVKWYNFFGGEFKNIKKDLKKDIEAFSYIAEYIESKNENVFVEIEKEEDDEDSS